MLTDTAQLAPSALLEMASTLTQLAMGAKASEKRAGKAKFNGTPRDPAVKRLAALKLKELRNDFTFDEIGKMLGVTRERAFQLHKTLVG